MATNSDDQIGEMGARMRAVSTPTKPSTFLEKAFGRLDDDWKVTPLPAELASPSAINERARGVDRSPLSLENPFLPPAHFVRELERRAASDDLVRFPLSPEQREAIATGAERVPPDRPPTARELAELAPNLNFFPPEFLQRARVNEHVHADYSLERFREFGADEPIRFPPGLMGGQRMVPAPRVQAGVPQERPDQLTSYDDQLGWQDDSGDVVVLPFQCTIQRVAFAGRCARIDTMVLDRDSGQPIHVRFQVPVRDQSHKELRRAMLSVLEHELDEVLRHADGKHWVDPHRNDRPW